MRNAALIRANRPDWATSQICCHAGVTENDLMSSNALKQSF